MKETYRDNAKDPELKVYNPWGKVGAGAPMLDLSGNPRQNVFGKIQSEVIIMYIYLKYNIYNNTL